MDVTVAVIAQDLKVHEDGTFDIFGILGGWRVSAVPYLEPHMTLFISLSASPVETEVERTIEVHLIDADGKLIRRSWDTVTVPKSPRQGSRAGLNLNFPLRNVPFPQAGDYSFHILIEKDEKRVVPFYISVEEGES